MEGDMKWILKYEGFEEYGPDSSSSRYSPRTGSCEHGNQPQASIRGPQYFDCVLLLLLTCQKEPASQMCCFIKTLLYGYLGAHKFYKF
jgi:hypothetical protein